MSTPPPAARSEPTGTAASAERDEHSGGHDGKVALKVRTDMATKEGVGGGAAPPAPPKYAHTGNGGSSSSEGLTAEGRTQLDHLENELGRLVRALTAGSNSSAGSDVDNIGGSSTSSSGSSEYDLDDDDDDDDSDEEETNQQNAVGRISEGASSGDKEIATADHKPSSGGLSSSNIGGDDMMDAVEGLLESSASSSRSKTTSTTTTTNTTAAAQFTLSGKKITYLTVTELHKEKRRLKRRLREMKNERKADEERVGISNDGDHGGSADLYYEMYRAITEQITMLEWKELMEQTGGNTSSGSSCEGSFAAACAKSGITQRGKQQSDLVRIIEEDDECDADDGSGASANANAFDDSDSNADDYGSSGAESTSEGDCSMDDSASGTISGFDDDDVDGLFDFRDDLEHENGGETVSGNEGSADDNRFFDEQFSSELFSPFTSPPNNARNAAPSTGMAESDSPLRPRKLFDVSIGAATNTTDAVRGTKCYDLNSQDQGPIINGPLPVVILLMDNDRGTFDLLGVRIDWQKRSVQDLLDIVISSGKGFDVEKQVRSPQTKEKGKREIPIVSPLSCGSARPREDNTSSKDLDEDNDIISTTSSIGNPPMEINVDSSSCLHYDGLIQYRLDGHDEESLVEGMLLINYLGLRRYSVVPQEVLVAKPAHMSVKEMSEHVDELFKRLLRVDMLSCDDTALTLSSLALNRIIEGSSTLFPGCDDDAIFLSFSPPFEVCTMKDPIHQKLPSGDADETGSTLITEDDVITHSSDLLDVYPCKNDEDNELYSPDALLKKSWDALPGDFFAATTPPLPPSSEGRQSLLGGRAYTMQLPSTCKPRTGTRKFSLKGLASIARGAKKQVNDSVVDAETIQYLRAKSNAGGKKYSKVVEETNISTKSEDEKTSASAASNECSACERRN